ncbi:cytochrome P450 [Streptomyces oceani]|uniref:Cytochrome n=1 Tax=Streptomyces oceani TaxID=1075402 RepID=A0A1E7KGT4_9ACTN|nr:cytochrome P450 [Streptomyces oceani]OEV03147.1 cytochrome [Streptomyces oceani]
MTSPNPSAPPSGCPAHQGRTPLYGDVLSGDTLPLYEEMRRTHGPVAPIELEPGVPGWLVLGYRELLEVTRNEECFSHDSRYWRALREGQVRKDSPLLPMMGYRPTVLHTDGPTHRRFSSAVADSLGRIDQHQLRRTVTQLANNLIDEIAPTGHADLAPQYAHQLPLWVASRLFGLPDELAPRIIAGVQGLADSGAEAQASSKALEKIFTDLVQDRSARRRDDLPSWLFDHSSQLTVAEVLHHLMVVIVAGNGPAANWILNTARLLLLDARFRANLTGGRRTVDSALDETLWRDTPVQNFPGRYATRDLNFGGQYIRSGDVLILGLTAANHDPAVQPPDGRIVPGNRSHVAFGAGPHTCPARDPARVIAHTAVNTLIHRLPDMQLTVAPEELSYRPSPWSRALQSLPVRFTPTLPLNDTTGERYAQ